MNKQELDSLLQEMGVTEENMEKHWQDNVTYGKNKSIVNAHNKGYTWRNLSAESLRKLPTLLETDKACVKANYSVLQRLNRNTETMTLEEKVKAKITLTENEIKEVVNEYSIEDIPGEDNRWTRNITSIIQIDNEYYMINWERGLTECQEDYYPEQPVKVIKEEKVVTQTVVEWLRVLE